MVIKNLIAGLLLLMCLVSAAKAKTWKGITPLKSTRADVERLMGKPNQHGRYEIENERINIWYSEGSCESSYGGLAKENCECLVPKDTVLKIGVTLDPPVKVSKLGIDKKKYERTPVHAYQPTATYADFGEGVVYTIRESDNTVTNIDYLPSARECEELIKKQGTRAPVSGWQGIVPVRSTRADVQRLLGSPSSSLAGIDRYDLTENRLDVSYSADPCKVSGANSLGTAADVVLKMSVTPRRPVLVQDLVLDKNKYIRIQDDHPDNWVHYLNSADGITVDAVLEKGCEQVLSIIFQATAKDRESRCSQSTL